MRKAYEDSAELCRALAVAAKSDEERDLFLKIAETWNWLFQEADDGEAPSPAGSGA